VPKRFNRNAVSVEDCNSMANFNQNDYELLENENMETSLNRVKLDPISKQISMKKKIGFIKSHLKDQPSNIEKLRSAINLTLEEYKPLKRYLEVRASDLDSGYHQLSSYLSKEVIR